MSYFIDYTISEGNRKGSQKVLPCHLRSCFQVFGWSEWFAHIWFPHQLVGSPNNKAGQISRGVGGEQHQSWFIILALFYFLSSVQLGGLTFYFTMFFFFGWIAHSKISLILHTCLKVVRSFEFESGRSEQPKDQWFHWDLCVPVQSQQKCTSVQDCRSQELQYVSIMVNFYHFLSCFGGLSRDVDCHGSGFLHLVSNNLMHGPISLAGVKKQV